MPEVDRCVICLEQLDSKPMYSLPECNHTFHQNCIMHWFRQGNFKCPLCNETGALYTQQDDHVWPGIAIVINIRYCVVSARRKNAPAPLKKYIARVAKDKKKNSVNWAHNRELLKTVEGQFGALHEGVDNTLTS